MNKRKLALSLTTIVAATCITAHTFAAPDYQRIKKDINVMIGIVKSSFNNTDDCKSCNVKITGHYLADQGVVFNVNPSSHDFYSFSQSGDGITRSVIAIPGMVEEILEDVQIRLDGGDFQSWEFHTEEDWSDSGRETREELREARQDLRELSRELRELEIERIHAEKEELEKLKSREKKLMQEIAKAESDQEKIMKGLTRYTEERTKKRDSRRAKKLEERRQQFEQMESIVLDTFCDYSSTMRNVPDDERVSIIVRKGDDEANIYVFEQSELATCDSEKTNVREHALSYAF